MLQYDLIPSSLRLEGVRCTDGESLGSGAFADVFCGEYRSERVALKRLRISAADSEEKKQKNKKVNVLIWILFVLPC